jgi:hypothetical protein
MLGLSFYAKSYRNVSIACITMTIIISFRVINLEKMEHFKTCVFFNKHVLFGGWSQFLTSTLTQSARFVYLINMQKIYKNDKHYIKRTHQLSYNKWDTYWTS